MQMTGLFYFVRALKYRISNIDILFYGYLERTSCIGCGSGFQLVYQVSISVIFSSASLAASFTSASNSPVVISTSHGITLGSPISPNR